MYQFKLQTGSPRNSDDGMRNQSEVLIEEIFYYSFQDLIKIIINAVEKKLNNVS